MSARPLFHQIGPYVIDRQIGVGGMALVFLARDTRDDQVVALKIVPEGTDEDAIETVAAERRGAELQQTYLAGSEYVPQVYEVGHTPGYLYIAMEYLDGEDLSTIIARGPIEASRAAGLAIQLCRFLEEIDHLDLAAVTGTPLTLLHNDLKPRNVRVMARDRLKVLDFGAAKALSMSRRATRNEFYSTPYLSPECLESGERDRQADAWAVGVILYEMVTGRPPFRGDDTRRLEDRIRSRRPPEPIGDGPRGLHAVIGKLLAPYSPDRYATPAAIREDLERVLAGELPDAEREGWPERSTDEPPTRRTARAADDEPPTRRVPRTSPASEPPHLDDATAAQTATTAAPVRRHRWIRVALVLLVLTPLVNEGCLAGKARRLEGTLPMQEFAELTSTWSAYDTLRTHSYLGLGTRGLGRALERQTLILAERVASNYRTPAPTVREAQWTAAEKALEIALAHSPNNDLIRGTLRYTQGQLLRIDGEASKGRGQTDKAQRNLTDAVIAFREAAAARPNWPDPFLGLARTFIYGLEDIDRGADAIARAQQLGHAMGAREMAQLADGYRARAENLEHAAATVGGMPQEREFLTRSREAYQKALDYYTKIADVPDGATQTRSTQRRLDVIDRKLAELGARTPAPPASAPGATLIPGAARDVPVRRLQWV